MTSKRSSAATTVAATNAAAGTKVDIAEVRNGLGKLTVTVSLEGEVEGHPEYKLTVVDKLHMQEYEVKNRFKKFRAVKDKMDKETKGLITAQFPKTLAKSSFGIALNEKELKERTDALNSWLADIMANADKISPGAAELLADFVNLDHMEDKAEEAAAAAKKIEKAFIKKKQNEAEKKRKEEEEAEKKKKEDEAAAVEEVKRKNSFFRKQNTPQKDKLVDVSEIKAEVPKAGCGCVIA